MRQFHFFSLFLLFLFLSCAKKHRSSAVESTSDSATNTRDPYWVDRSVGANNTEKKQQLAKKFNSLLVFHADDTMQVKHVYTATLALARNAELEPIKIKVLDASDASDDKVIVDTSIELGKRMRAELIDQSSRDEPSFLIKALGSDEQNLSKNRESIWQWSIEPLRVGEHKLKLAVEVVLADDDRVNLPARNIPITIFAQKVSAGARIQSFFSNYWQWIITGIFLPIFIAWLTTRIKQTSEPKKK